MVKGKQSHTVKLHWGPYPKLAVREGLIKEVNFKVRLK